MCLAKLNYGNILFHHYLSIYLCLKLLSDLPLSAQLMACTYHNYHNGN